MADANTKLLLHCDGADESTTFTDSGSTGHSDTAVNDAQLDTAQKYFGTAAGLFDGTGDCVTYPNHADWDRGTGHYTIDARVRLNANGKEQWIVGKNSAPTYYQISFFINSSNYLCGRCDKTSGPTIFNSVASNLALSTGTWYHVALVINRTTNKMQLFVNGVETTYSTQDTIDGTAYTNSVVLIIGAKFADGSVDPFDGWIDELRMSKGVARWTSNFTPPNAAYDSILIEASTLAAEAALYAPSLSLGCTVSPAALSAEATLHAPALSFDRTVTPATLTALATLQTPVTVHIQYPGSFSALATLHVPTLSFDMTVTPATLAAAATLQTPVIALDALVTPAALAALATLHAPTVSIYYTAIPAYMLADLIAPYSGGAWLWLIEVIVPGYDTVRLARNTDNMIYGKDLFLKSNFDVGKLPLSGDGTIPRIALRIAQDDTHNLEAIMNATKGFTGGTVKLIRTCSKYAETPVQDLEATYAIRVAGSDSAWVILTLGIPNPLLQRIPRELYSSSVCPLATPTLFKGVKCQYTGEDTICTGLFEDCWTKGNAQHWGAELGLNPNSVRI